ncbi:MAG: hypothetical protein ACT6TH_03250 [Brevundimonas sp.]|jgi:hypothetical protein|uniref:hypothetical protein n=1 Tax=Brevundimonas sp. TaxID=1871086 RepID=UPI004033780D
MIRRLLLASSVLALAACNAPEEPATAPTPTPETPVTEPAAPSANVLSAQGFGPLRIGMTTAEIEAALGPDANPNAVGGADPESCDQFRPQRAPENMLVMTERGVLTSIWLTRTSDIPTDRGFRIGDSAASIKAAYGSAATVELHKYEPAPAEYITVWSSSDHTSPAARGIKYEIGQDGNVKAIAAGGPSISYVEGCA